MTQTETWHKQVVLDRETWHKQVVLDTETWNKQVIPDTETWHKQVVLDRETWHKQVSLTLIECMTHRLSLTQTEVCDTQKCGTYRSIAKTGCT